ncbi:MAG: phosphopentomutase [Alphaproteobacteria bacterium]|nr:phosphopentomutase [Alphaproteobacteria bacterium]
MARAFLLVLDSLGIGGAPDAARFGDEGADTLGHIARHRPLRLPYLAALGLGEACRLATGHVPPGLAFGRPRGAFGCAAQRSEGKDTPSGHWELAGVPNPVPWTVFPRSSPCFPPELIAALCDEAGLPGILGDRHASGTAIVSELGEAHLRSGKPICYTSADSVFQIAAHEGAFGLERLWAVCEVARRLADPWRIGRVIARPFVGSPAEGFTRTANRRDLTMPPPAPTLLDRARADGREVISVGKIGDIFAHAGTGVEVKAEGNHALFDRTLEGMRELGEGGLLVANFVDFDTLFGHRRDVAGYAAALEAFDARIPELVAAMRPGDGVVITADHGCDPTWPGSDHTREQVPVLAFGTAYASGSIGRRTSFADVGAAISRRLGLPAPIHGTAF